LTGEFSVVQFFHSGEYECVRRFVDAETAVKAAYHYTHSVAAKLGIVDKVIITDGGDHTNFMWEYGKGVVYPKRGADGRFDDSDKG
jgi:hypothetical protein